MSITQHLTQAKKASDNGRLGHKNTERALGCIVPVWMWQGPPRGRVTISYQLPCRYMSSKHCRDCYQSGPGYLWLLALRATDTVALSSQQDRTKPLCSFTSPLSTFQGKQASSYSIPSILIKKKGGHQMMLHRIKCGEAKGGARVVFAVLWPCFSIPSHLFWPVVKSFFGGRLAWSRPFSPLPLCLRDIQSCVWYILLHDTLRQGCHCAHAGFPWKGMQT